MVVSLFIKLRYRIISEYIEKTKHTFDESPPFS